MPRARLVDPQRYRAELRARRTVRYLRRQAAQVPATGTHAENWHKRQVRAMLLNGAWAVEDFYHLHPKEE